MAFAVVSSLLQTVDQILNDDQYPISVDGKQKIASMIEQVHSFEELLKNFPKETSRLEKRMRDAANEAEDILENFMYEQIRLRRRLSRSVAAGIKNPNSNPKQYDFDELKWVMKEMDSIDGEVMAMKIGELGFTDSPAPISPAVSISSSTVVSPAHDNIVVGFDEHLLKMKDMLCGDSPQLQVIPIVGMGGIGKTTLARIAYNDPLIQQYFYIHVWVTVSQDYKTENIVSNLVDSLKGFKEAKGGGNEEKVYKSLIGRRYLIVLDDMWSTEAWDDLKRLFPDNHDGSRIMLTTRVLDVASYANSSTSVYKLHLLNPEKSWNLLSQKVFKRQNIPVELENVGKEIASSCGGLPLAIVLIAGVLSTISETQASWKKIAKDVNSVVDQSGQVDEIISLSYTHLPHHLRPCFLYMGCFPEDYEFHVSKLIKLWMAEGFVKPSSFKSFEVAAEEYLENILNRSLAFVKRRKSDGQIKSCSIHDLVREFCKRKAQEENLQRRLSIAHAHLKCGADTYVSLSPIRSVVSVKPSETSLDSLQKLKLPQEENLQHCFGIPHSDLKCLAKTYGSTIRSVVCFEPSEISLVSLRKLRLLRLLDVVDANSNVYSLPAQVFELFHLRYLAFGCPMNIPPAISMLHNLQTLIICPRKGSQHYTKDEVYLPLEIWMLPQLRHLVSFFDLLPDPDETSSFSLKNLQTLCVVKKFVCTKRILERIPHLKKLGITLFADKGPEASQLDNLCSLHQLEKLKLIVTDSPLVRLMVNPVYPRTLKKLTLSGWRLPWKHMEVVGFLPNLQVLKLRDYACQGDTWETIEDQFPSLKYLLIDWANLQNWITDSTHFPRLKSLVIYRCSRLVEIPSCIGEIPTLELIEVDQANKSMVESAKRIQEEQIDYGNEDLQVHSVRYHYRGF